MTGCALHRYHWPKPLGLVVHHIWPKGAGGPDVDSNKVTLCSSGHLNTHRLLDDLWHGVPMRGGTRTERALAQRGYDAWVAAGKPKPPVYEITSNSHAVPLEVKTRVHLDGKTVARPPVVRTIILPEQKVPGKRTGRHVSHDERSRAYAVAPQTTPLVSVRHKRLVPVYDQGDLGSCVPHAGKGALSTAPFHRRFTSESGIRQTYKELTASDDVPGQWPPDDTGSDALSFAKLAVRHKWCSSYSHCFSLDAVLTALQTGPVMLGVSWLSGFDNPTAAGQMLYKGSVRGGHEIVADEIDVENKRVWITNSWGTDWGMQGRAWWSFDDLGKILADNGDATVLNP